MIVVYFNIAQGQGVVKISCHPASMSRMAFCAITSVHPQETDLVARTHPHEKRGFIFPKRSREKKSVATDAKDTVYGLAGIGCCLIGRNRKDRRDSGK